VVALAGSLAACGGEESDDLIGEDSVRECLANSGFGRNPPAGEAVGYAPLYLSTAPDFSAYSDGGIQVDVVVQGSDEKAERTAENVRGAMLPLGISDAGERVLSGGNVVAVFAGSPSAADADAVSSCLK
jgi:hypothetical protein